MSGSGLVCLAFLVLDLDLNKQSNSSGRSSHSSMTDKLSSPIYDGIAKFVSVISHALCPLDLSLSCRCSSCAMQLDGVHACHAMPRSKSRPLTTRNLRLVCFSRPILLFSTRQLERFLTGGSSDSGVHSSGWKFGLLKWAVL